jgi:hypothetical protein
VQPCSDSCPSRPGGICRPQYMWCGRGGRGDEKHGRHRQGARTLMVHVCWQAGQLARPDAANARACACVRVRECVRALRSALLLQPFLTVGPGRVPAIGLAGPAGSHARRRLGRVCCQAAGRRDMIQMLWCAAVIQRCGVRCSVPVSLCRGHAVQHICVSAGRWCVHAPAQACPGVLGSCPCDPSASCRRIQIR